MKHAAWMLFALVVASCLAGLAIAQHGFGPTVYYDQFSAGTWTNLSGVASGAVYSVGGTLTNGVQTNYYRVSYTNIKGRGPATGWKIVFTGNTNTSSSAGTNAVNIRWAQKGGAAAYVVEKSWDAGTTWSNWISVGATMTNWVDRGTNSWTNSIFTNAFPLIPAPSYLFAGTNSTGLITSAAADAGKYLKADGTWASPPGGGDMLIEVYDVDSNDVVDDAEALGGVAAASYATKAELPTDSWNQASADATTVTSSIFVTASGVGFGGPGATNLDIYQPGGNPTIRLTDPRSSSSWTPGTAIGTVEFYGSDLSGPGSGIRGWLKTIVDDAEGTSYGVSLGTSSNAASAEAMRIYGDKRVAFGGSLVVAGTVQAQDATASNHVPTKAQVDAGTNVLQASINSLSNSFSGTSRFPFLDTTSGSNNISLANGLCPTVNTNDYTRYIWQILTPTSNVTYYPPTGAVELAISMRLDVCPGTNTAVVATNGFCPVYACTNPAVTLYPSATNRLLLEKPYGATSWMMWQMSKVP